MRYSNNAAAFCLMEAIVFIAWGEKYIGEIRRFLDNSSPKALEIDKILVTDYSTNIDLIKDDFISVIRLREIGEGLLPKSTFYQFLPSNYDVFCFLDTDTIVLGDISFGFLKAKQFGIAMAHAPHYSLQNFWGYRKIMEAEEWPLCEQMQYNTGVIFFRKDEAVGDVFRCWNDLCQKHQLDWKDDQAHFTLALEQCNFNPYTLSPNWNYRGFGNYVSGSIVIWHSHYMPPSDVNNFQNAWPPRRIWPGNILEPVKQAGQEAGVAWVYKNVESQ